MEAPHAAGFGWRADPNPLAQHNALDPASEWALGHGADFEFAAAERIVDPADHRFLIAVSHDPVGEGAERYTRLLPIDEASEVDEPLKAMATGYALPERHIFPAPLRARSVRSGEPPPPLAPISLRLVQSERKEYAPEPESGAISDRSDDAIRAESAPAWSMPPGVRAEDLIVMAIIDDGINVAHERFRTADGSRVDYAWMQDGERCASVPYGREFGREEIEAALAGASDDEEALGRLGLADFCRPGEGAGTVARRASHGTHVLDLAAGADPHDAAAAARRIIAVQLPRLVTRDTSGQLLSAFFVAGLGYILDRTRAISAVAGRPVPLVVNFSYGTAGGPHDGGHFVEEAMERLVADHRAAGGGPAHIVVPTGNRNLSRGFATVSAQAEGPTRLSLDWFQPPADGTSSYLEVWLPAGRREVVLRIAAPGGEMAPVPLADGARVLMRAGDPSSVVARATWDEPRLWRDGAAKGRILVALAPTDPVLPSRSAAPSGTWHIEVEARLGAGECIEAWIQRDDLPFGYASRGRQSTFLDAHYQRFDPCGALLDADPAEGAGSVRRSGTMSGTATARTAALVVGGYCGGVAPRMARYSGTAAGTHRGPDVAAIADRSPLRRGLLAAGNRCGHRVALSGTSVATPLVTRWVADAFAVDPSVDIADALRSHLSDPAHRLFDPPANRGGAGALRPSAIVHLD